MTLRGLGWFLERTYISCKVNIDRPGPQAHGRISKHWCRAGSGAPMLLALSSEPLSVCSLWETPSVMPSIHLQQVDAYSKGFLSSACNRSRNVNVEEIGVSNL